MAQPMLARLALQARRQMARSLRCISRPRSPQLRMRRGLTPSRSGAC